MSERWTVENVASGAPLPAAPRLPAEWEPQESLWLTWPVSRHIWPQKRDSIWEKFAEIAGVASRFQAVDINADESAHLDILSHLRQFEANLPNVRLHNHQSDDVWCRDHGPIFVRDGEKLIATDWRFNAWGGKFEAYQRDDTIPRWMAGQIACPRIWLDAILEGGAIDSNGAATLLTTTPVLLNENRNPAIERANYEALFEKIFGVTRTLWLPEGTPNDDTDGHIDNVARFFSKAGVLLASGPNLPAMEENRRVLAAEGLAIRDLPGPDFPIQSRGQSLPASYLNFVVLNGAVLVPQFAQTKSDARACAILRECFPGREIIGIDCRILLEEGGALHCLTCNQPAVG